MHVVPWARSTSEVEGGGEEGGSHMTTQIFLHQTEVSLECRRPLRCNHAAGTDCLAGCAGRRRRA